jgi:hypothetical protein
VLPGASVIPFHGILMALGCSAGRLASAAAVRLGPNDWLVRGRVGSGWQPAPDPAALEADRVNWQRCGSGWRLLKLPTTKVGALPDAELVGLVREAFRTGQCKKSFRFPSE